MTHDPFEQFKGLMERLCSPMTGPGQVFFYKPRSYGVKPPEDVCENLKAVSADQEAETVRRAKKVNKKIDEWREEREADDPG